MENFYDAFAAGFVGGQTTPQIKQLMSTTAANPGQPWAWNQYDAINGMTVEEAMRTGKIQRIQTPGSADRGELPWANESLNQYGSVDQFGANLEPGGDTRGRIWGVGADGRLQDLGLSETSQWGTLNAFLGTALAGGAATAAAGGGTAGAAMGGAEMATAGAGGLTPGMAGTGAFGTAAAGAAGAGGAAAGSGPMSVGGAGGLPAQAGAAGAGGLSSLLGGAGGLGNLIGGLGSLWDTYQNYRNVGDMRDWLTSQTPDLPFYQDKLKTSYENPGSYWEGADFNAGFDVLHNKLQRNDAAGGRLAADAGRQSELQKYTLDSLNNYRSGLAGVVNDQTRARVGANEAFMNNLNNRADAISPITTWLGNLMGNQ